MEVISKFIKGHPLIAGNATMLQEQIRERENQLKQFKSYIEMSYNEFSQLLSANARSILLQRHITHDFIIDNDNEHVIYQLYLYFTNNAKCNWNLNAGLIFAGKIGCGKSLLMKSFLKISDEYSRKLTTDVHSKSLATQIKINGIEYYSRRPLFIDELGREENEVKDYGNVLKPMIDLFSIRYEVGARTYVTTNYKCDSLDKFYGDFIRSRMEEMMTYVVIPGESRRLKNEIKTK